MASSLRIAAAVYGFAAMLVAVFLVAPSAGAQGLVPMCGSGIYDQAIYCQFCHLFELFNNIIQYLIILGSVVAACIFAWAGILMFTAAGNASQIEKAKRLFGDAFLGFVVALVSVLVVQTLVNSLGAGQLTWQRVQCSSNRIVDGGLRVNQGPTISPEGLGTDLPAGYRGPLVTTGDCAASNPAMRESFGSLSDQFSCICQRESTGQPIPSTIDKSWVDGRSFSYGYMQINMVSTNPFTCDPGDGKGKRTFDCRQAFEKGPDALMKECRTLANGVRICGSAGFAYRVVRDDIYKECTDALSTQQCNFAAAWTLYKSGGFNHWSTTARACQLL